MRIRKSALAVVAVIALILSTASSCPGDNSNGRGDAPVGEIDTGTAEIINFPDTFGNVAHKCDNHGHRVYTTTHGTGDSTTTNTPVVIDDPTCPGGRPS